MLRTAAIVLFAGRIALAGEAPPAVVRLAPPGAEAIAAAAKELRAILKDEFAARDPAARAALAQKLIDLGGKGSPAARCAALREAEELAGRLGDTALAERSAGVLTTAFAIDPAEERLRAFAGCVANAGSVETLNALVESCLALADDAVDSDSYAFAERAAQQAEAAAKRLRDQALVPRVRAQLLRIRALAEEWRKVGAGGDLLGQPDAAEIGRLGRFHCLSKGAWAKGLPDLAKGDDPAMAAAARAELDAKTPPQQAAAGLAWADLAAKQPRGEPREAVLLHAAGLLRLAIPGLDVLERARDEKRLAELERQLGGAGRRPSLPPGAVLYLSCERDTLIQSGGKLVVQDLSGNGCNATASGAKPVSGTWGGSLECAGDQGLDCGNPPSLRITGNLTVAMWLRPGVIGGVRRNPFHKSFAGEGTVTLETSGQMNYFYGVSGHDEEGHYQAVTSDFPLEANTWMHVAVVRDFTAKTVTWFRNGKRTNSVATAYPAAKASDQPLLIGRGYAGGYVGQIDEFGMWSRALRDPEIATLYATAAAGR